MHSFVACHNRLAIDHASHASLPRRSTIQSYAIVDKYLVGVVECCFRAPPYCGLVAFSCYGLAPKAARSSNTLQLCTRTPSRTIMPNNTCYPWDIAVNCFSPPFGTSLGVNWIASTISCVNRANSRVKLWAKCGESNALPPDRN